MVVAPGGTGVGTITTTTAALIFGVQVNTRQAYIQGIDNTATTGFGYVPNQTGAVSGYESAKQTTRRYQVNLALGLLTQDKLVSLFQNN